MSWSDRYREEARTWRAAKGPDSPEASIYEQLAKDYDTWEARMAEMDRARAARRRLPPLGTTRPYSEIGRKR